ncbi:MAG TPA: hypothetical protein GXZ23_05460 [Clostridiales bacterium]|nr:hypothetical protein [Clostridiales bacterium]
MKKIRLFFIILLSISIISCFSGCSLTESNEDEVQPYVESKSKNVKVPDILVSQIKGEKLVIQDGAKEITAEMLAGKTLVSIDIPASVKFIEKDIIDKNTVIICVDNSYAADFASENNYWYYKTYSTLDENNKRIEKTGLFSNENIEISDTNPANSLGFLHNPEGEIWMQDAGRIFAYVNGLVDIVNEGKPYISFSRDYKVDDVELAPIGTDDDSAIQLLRSARNILRNIFLDNAKSDEFMPVPEVVEFGEENFDIVAIDEIPFSDEYLNDDEFSASCIESDIMYKILINLGKIESEALYEGAFGCIPTITPKEITAEFDKLSAFVDVADEYETKIADCKIEVMADRITDQLEELKLTKISYITATAKGVGDFEYLGEFEITFKFTDIYKIGCDWTADIEE